MSRDLEFGLRMLKNRFGWLLITSIWGIFLSCGGGCGSKDGGYLDIKRGGTPVVDGVFSASEWSDANSIQIHVEGSRRVNVYFKHDDSHLYIAFSNLPQKGKRLFPEVFLDTDNSKTAYWESSDWWFHASHNDCEGQGIYDIYTFGINGSCQPDHTDWAANNFTNNFQGIIEIRISYEKFGLVPEKGKSVGIAFDITDATRKCYFWPAEAEKDHPSTWAIASSSDGWQ